MKKWILRSILALVALFIITLIVLYFSLNTLVRAGVIRGGKYATDQNTGLNAANLSLSAGSLKLDNFDIANLAGYTQPKLLAMKSCFTSVESSSLFSHTVKVNEITIDGLEVWLEQNGMKNNLNDLLAVIQKKTPAAGDSQKSSPGKQLKIGTLKITGTKVHIRGLVTMDLNLPDLEIKDPTNPDGRPMKIADLIGTVLVHLAKQIMESPQIPGGIKDAMNNATAIVNNLKGVLDKNLKELPNLKDLNIPDAGKNVQNLGKNLQNLNPFDKKNPEKQ